MEIILIEVRDGVCYVNTSTIPPNVKVVVRDYDNNPAGEMMIYPPENEPFQPTGYCTISNAYGVEIEIYRTGEAARLKWSDEYLPGKWKEIKYSLSGRPYIYGYKRRWYLDEFLKYPS